MWLVCWGASHSRASAILPVSRSASAARSSISAAWARRFSSACDAALFFLQPTPRTSNRTTATRAPLVTMPRRYLFERELRNHPRVELRRAGADAAFAEPGHRGRRLRRRRDRPRERGRLEVVGDE